MSMTRPKALEDSLGLYLREIRKIPLLSARD